VMIVDARSCERPFMPSTGILAKQRYYSAWIEPRCIAA